MIFKMIGITLSTHAHDFQNDQHDLSIHRDERPEGFLKPFGSLHTTYHEAEFTAVTPDNYLDFVLP